MNQFARRRIFLLIFFAVLGLIAAFHESNFSPVTPKESTKSGTQLMHNEEPKDVSAIKALRALPVKGRAQKTGYSRAEFGDGWGEIAGCSTREVILLRDLLDTKTEGCHVLAGTLDDPYSGKRVSFVRGESTSAAVQIDHVVALSNAWQTGAQQLSYEKRVALANDPLELLASDGPTNQQKSDGDAATWLPQKSFRCQYIARQIAVKQKYELWVTNAEKKAMESVLGLCPAQEIPTE